MSRSSLLYILWKKHFCSCLLKPFYFCSFTTSFGIRKIRGSNTLFILYSPHFSVFSFNFFFSNPTDPSLASAALMLEKDHLTFKMRQQNSIQLWWRPQNVNSHCKKMFNFFVVFEQWNERKLRWHGEIPNWIFNI